MTIEITEPPARWDNGNYTYETLILLKDKLCEYAEQGMAIIQMSRLEHMPRVNTIYDWLQKDKEFRDRFLTARRNGDDLMCERLIDVAHDLNREIILGAGRSAIALINSLRLQFDAIRWVLVRKSSGKYGNETTIKFDPNDVSELSDEQLKKEMKRIHDALKKSNNKFYLDDDHTITIPAKKGRKKGNKDGAEQA